MSSVWDTLIDEGDIWEDEEDAGLYKADQLIPVMASTVKASASSPAVL